MSILYYFLCSEMGCLSFWIKKMIIVNLEVKKNKRVDIRKSNLGLDCRYGVSWHWQFLNLKLEAAWKTIVYQRSLLVLRVMVLVGIWCMNCRLYPWVQLHRLHTAQHPPLHQYPCHLTHFLHQSTREFIIMMHITFLFSFFW